MGAGRDRRRLVVAGVLAGLAIGATVGVTSLTGASPGGVAGFRPVVLHVARVLADPETDLDLSVSLYCPHVDRAACEVERAIAHVLPAGSGGWTDVVGTTDGAGYRFEVPGALVADDGLSYWFEFVIAGGETLQHPEAGAAAPFRVVTTAGLREVRWPGTFDWMDLARADDSIVRLGYGDGDHEVGRIGGVGEEQPLGPSSFDVAADGSVYVADWVHRRVLVLSPRGVLRGEVPLPVRRPVDLAVGPRGELTVTTLGLGATAFELEGSGRVVGRYAVGAGVVERIAATPAGPQVWVGPGQWAPVRSRIGVALPAAAQARALAPAVPGPDGAVALSEDLSDGRIAFVWTRPDGSRTGAVLMLPTGVLAGVDYLVRGIPDGGAVAARGLWAEGREAVAVLRFAADGGIASAELIAAPSHEMDAAASAIRFRAPNEVLAFFARPDGVRIDRYEVRSR
jgi:hypothetical protein